MPRTLRPATAGQEELVSDILELLQEAVRLSNHTDTPRLREKLIRARSSAYGAKRHARRRRETTDAFVASIT